MDVTITINTDNAAFEGDPSTEIARILRDLAQRVSGDGIENVCRFATLRDYNGNRVGMINTEENA